MNKPVLMLLTVLFLALLLAGCGPRQRDTETGAASPDAAAAPAAAPVVEARVWGNQPSYTIGWPIALDVGMLNTGEVVANVPGGEFVGVTLNVRLGEETVTCQPLAAESPRGGLLPLAAGSDAKRPLRLDRQCQLTRPGHYSVEVIVEVPEYEGADVRGPLTPVNMEFDINLPDPPIVAVLEAPAEGTVGAPLEATLRVTNFGAEPVQMAPEARFIVRLAATSNGEQVPCSDPPRARGGGAARPLPTGESRELTLNLSDRCQFTIAGTYEVTSTVEIPRVGARSFTGTIEAPPVTFELAAAEAPEGESAEADAEEEAVLED